MQQRRWLPHVGEEQKLRRQADEHQNQEEDFFETGAQEEALQQAANAG